MFNQNKIGFICIDNIIENYVISCPVCCQSTKDVKGKDPVKSIEYNRPDTRYVFDITYLNKDMTKAFGIKYILNIFYQL